METPKKPWNFCETPEEKCTMNYCDESYSRMIEIINEKAHNLYRTSITKSENLIR